MGRQAGDCKRPGRRGRAYRVQTGRKHHVQHAVDNDIYLLVTGTVAVIVNGAQVAIRSAGQQIGEMAAIEPSLRRAATVTVLEHAVVLKLTRAAFMAVGEEHPEVWLPIAQELSKRLYQRNKTIYLPNQAPKLFIMSSSEALRIAHALLGGLEKDVFSTVCQIPPTTDIDLTSRNISSYPAIREVVPPQWWKNRHAVHLGTRTACRRSSYQCVGNPLAETGRLFNEHQLVGYAAST
ncbi:cyclic nucleotide-binding domain-containing protein [Bradyrhizobium sp. UFLA05-153]